MADQEPNNVPQSFHQEGDAIVFDTPPDPKEVARQRRENEQHEFARSQVKTNKTLAYFTGALVVATFCTIGVGIWQGFISQKAANAARDAVGVASNTLAETQSSNAVQKAANEKAFQATIDNFRQEERAWMGVDEIVITHYNINPPVSLRLPNGNVNNLGPGVQMTVDLKLHNFGHSAAQHVQIYPELLFAESPDKRRNDPGCKSFYAHSELGYTVLPTQPLEASHGVVAALTPDVISAIRANGGILLRILGCVVYTDSVSSQEIHHTPFSYALEYNGLSIIPPELTSSDGLLWKAKQLTIDPGPAN